MAFLKIFNASHISETKKFQNIEKFKVTQRTKLLKILRKPGLQHFIKFSVILPFMRAKTVKNLERSVAA